MHCVLLLIVVKPCPGGEPRCLEGSRPVTFFEGPLRKRERLRWWGSGGIGRYTGEVLPGELLAIPHDCRLQANWRASEASETPSIATYREKCLDGTSKPQCACSQFYVKRRCQRARSQLAVRECNYEKLSLLAPKRQGACTTNNLYFRSPLNGNHYFLVRYFYFDRT